MTEASLEMPWNPSYMRKGDRLNVPMVPRQFAPLIGCVTVYWGEFELRFNGLLSSFVAADNDPNDEDWHKRFFKTRRLLLAKKARNRFPGPVANEIRCIGQNAAVYYWQRNLVCHGHFTAGFKEGSPYILVNGTIHRRRFVVMPVTEPHLERMFHEIGMLTGRIEDLTAEDDSPCRLSSQDRSTLRAFLAKHPPHLPKPDKIAPQHPPYRW